MGLRNTIKGVTEAAFKATGDIPVSTNYWQFVSATYDTSAGSNTAAYTTLAGISVIFQEFEIVEIDGQNIRPTDKQMLITAKSISSIVPSLNDVIRVTTESWNVRGVKTDPADALWIAHVRRSA